MLLNHSFSGIANVSKVFVISLVGGAINIGITVARALAVTKMPFRSLFAAQLPPLLINLTTSAQVSALPESMKCCKDK